MAWNLACEINLHILILEVQTQPRSQASPAFRFILFILQVIKAGDEAGIMLGMRLGMRLYSPNLKHSYSDGRAILSPELSHAQL